MSTQRLTRRDMLAGAVAAGLCSVTPLTARARGLSANERIRVGLVGAGRRGMQLADALLRVSGAAGAELTGVCDLWRLRREAACAHVRERTGRMPEAWRNLDELIDAGRCDAVMIATPDFSHAPLCAMAVGAGLDVYVEAPLAHTDADAAAVVAACRSSGRVVQVGTQARSDPQWIGLVRRVAAGRLGAIVALEANCRGVGRLWQRPEWVARLRERDTDWQRFLLGREDWAFDPRRYVDFRHYRALSAGLAGAWLSHIVDAADMLAGGVPVACAASGAVCDWPDGRENPDTIVARVDYAGSGVPVRLMCRGSVGGAACENVMRVVAQGGVVEMRGADVSPCADDATDEHVANWLACVRDRRVPRAPVEAGYAHAVAVASAVRAMGSRW